MVDTRAVELAGVKGSVPFITLNAVALQHTFGYRSIGEVSHRTVDLAVSCRVLVIWDETDNLTGQLRVVPLQETSIALTKPIPACVYIPLRSQTYC